MLRTGAHEIALWPDGTPLLERLVGNYPEGPTTAPASLYSPFWEVSEIMDDAIEAIGLHDRELSLHDLLTLDRISFVRQAIDALSCNSRGKWSYEQVDIERGGMFDGFDYDLYGRWDELSDARNAAELVSSMS
jgi:hypothetical protein